MHTLQVIAAHVAHWPTWAWLAVTAAALLLIVWLRFRLRRARIRSDRAVDIVATVIGLGWSSQGMWETATRAYRVPGVLAAILFVVFELMMVAQMLRAYRYRTDRPRRSRYVRAVWVIAAIMGVIVSLAEGWAQAPLRLAIPLLVAYTWWLGLTSDDDPADRHRGAWRWTWHRLGLELGLLDETEQDARAINRDRLTRRIRSLTFAERWGSAVLGTVLRRRIRLAKLMLVADDQIVTEVNASLKRAERVMGPGDQPTGQPAEAPAEQPNVPKIPEPIEQPEVPAEVPSPPPDPAPALTLPQGVHVREGRRLRGESLKRDAIDLMLASVSDRAPMGMSNAELAGRYAPPLKSRNAEYFGAEARRVIRAQASNGHRAEVGALG